MALASYGHGPQAVRGLAFASRTQRDNGSWPLEWLGDGTEVVGGASHHAAYFAVALHHVAAALGDHDLAGHYLPVARKGLDYALSLQRPDGAMNWASVGEAIWDVPLLIGNASVSLGLAVGHVAERAVSPRDTPRCQRYAAARGRLCEALNDRSGFDAGHRDQVKHAMHWYYPSLYAGKPLPVEGIDRYVMDGCGSRCVADQPWVTAAETAELTMALRLTQTSSPCADDLLACIEQMRDDDGGYWTGWQVAAQTHWPVQKTTWTAAAVLLAHDFASGGTTRDTFLISRSQSDE